MYLNDLFAVNTGNNSRKWKMLEQPKYNSKYGCNVHVFVSNIKVLAYGTEQIIRLSLLHSSKNGPWSVHVLSATSVPLKPCKILCSSMFIICKYFIFMLGNSLLANVCIALYLMLNNFLLTYLLTYLRTYNNYSTMYSY